MVLAFPYAGCVRTGIGQLRYRTPHPSRPRWLLTAWLLLALYASFLLVPLANASGGEEASLPACCRTHGKHHCAMQTNLDSVPQHAKPAFAAVSEKCPCTPFSPAGTHSATFSSTLNCYFFIPLTEQELQQTQTETRLRLAFARSKQNRGPPSRFPSA